MARLLTWFFHWLPLPLVLWFGRALGAVTFHLLRIRRRIVRENLERAFPELTAREREAIARRTYLNLGMMVVEFLRSPRMTPDEVEALLEVDGWEVVEEARAEDRGLIVATAHFGNWELLATSTAIRGLPLSVITRRMSQSRINAYWKDARRQAGLREIPDRESVRQILRVLRDKEVLGVVIDQNMRPPRGIFVPFFGVLASTLAVPAVLHERTGAPIVTAFLVRLPGGRHRLELRRYDYQRISEDRAENVRHNTARLNALLEDRIREHPDHWLWLHRRWKTRPEGEEGPAEKELAA